MVHSTQPVSGTTIDDGLIMKKILTCLVLLLIGGGLGSAAYFGLYKQQASSGRTSSDSSDAVYVTSVSTLAGLSGSGAQTVRLAGMVEPQNTWSATTSSDKTIKETYVKEGDMVAVGDKLFTYDTSEDEDTLAKTQIEIERTQSDLAQAQSQLEQLEAQKAKTRDQETLLDLMTSIATQENQIKQDEYDIKSKTLEMEKLRESIDDATVYSELAGVVSSISSKSSSSSSYSDSGSDAYITIMAVGEYRIKGTVNEQNISSVYVGEEMIAFSRVDSSQYWFGEVTEIKTDSASSNASDSDGSDSSTSSSTYPFYVTLESSDGLILGQHVYLEQNIGQTETKDGIWIDQYYFTEEEDGTVWVWAAGSGDKLEKRTVTLGETDEEQARYEVASGLSADDYITWPYDDDLEEGLPVKYVDYSMDDESAYEEDYGDEYYDDIDVGGSYEVYDADAEEGFLDEEGILPGDDEYYEDGSEYYDEEWYYEDGSEYYDEDGYYEDGVYYEYEEYEDGEEEYYEDDSEFYEDGAEADDAAGEADDAA